MKTGQGLSRRALNWWYVGAVVLLLCPSIAAIAGQTSKPPRYATTPFVEPDRCATAWVIRRFVHPDAVFEFHPHESMPEGVILFDLPEAEFKRDARRTTLESLIQKHGIRDPLVASLAGLIHEVEINAWARRNDAISRRFEQVLMTAVDEAESPDAALVVCINLLDRFRDTEGDVEGWVELVRPKRIDKVGDGEDRP